MYVCLYVCEYIYCVHMYVPRHLCIVLQDPLKTPGTIEVLRLDSSICCRDYRVNYITGLERISPIVRTSYADHRIKDKIFKISLLLFLFSLQIEI